MNIKGIVLKISNEVIIYPLFFKKVEGITLKTCVYRFLFMKLTIIYTRNEY